MTTAMAAASGAFSGDDRTTLSFGELWRMLWARWWLLLIGSVVGLALGLIAASQMTRTYTATAHVVVDSKAFAIPELQGAISGESSPDPLPAVTTAAIGLRSPTVLQSVVSELHLAASPYFNADLRPPTLMAMVKNRLRALFPDLFPNAAARPGQAEALAAMELERRLTIFTDNKSLDVSASVVLPDPELAARVVNAVVNRYIANRGAISAHIDEVANTEIKRLLASVGQEVETLDAKARDLRAENDLVTTLPFGSLSQQQLSELGSAKARATGDREQLEAKLKRAADLSRQGRSAELADVLSSPTIALLREQQAIAGERLAKLRSSVRPGSRLAASAAAESQEVQARITDETNRLVKSLTAQVAAARDREAAATASLNRASTAASKASRIQAGIDQVEKEATSRRAVYQALLERASQTSVSPEVAKVSPGVHVTSLADPPVLPSGPRTKIVGGLGMLAGLMLAGTVAIKRGSHRLPSLDAPDEVAAYLGTPSYFVLPSLARPRERAAPSMLHAAEQDRALRLLHTKLRHAAVRQGRDMRSVLFVGAGREEVADHARNFANLAARQGERVLLIDVGAEAPTMAGDPRADEELRAVLDGRAAWRDAVVRDGAISTGAIAAGSRAVERIDGAEAARLRSMLHEANDDYTLTVIAAGGDARSPRSAHLAQMADFTLVFVDPRKTSLTAAAAALDHIGTFTGNLGLGIIARRAA